MHHEFWKKILQEYNVFKSENIVFDIKYILNLAYFVSQIHVFERSGTSAGFIGKQCPRVLYPHFCIIHMKQDKNAIVFLCIKDGCISAKNILSIIRERKYIFTYVKKIFLYTSSCEKRNCVILFYKLLK